MNPHTPQPLLRRLRRERGAVLIQVAIALLVLMGFVAIVVDQGLQFVGRRQLQNVADAGALAGAIAYTFDPQPGQDPRIPAEASARTVAFRHHVIDGGAMGFGIGWDCPAWMDDDGCVRVDVFRDGTNGSAMLPVFMSQVFGVNSQRGRATATAQIADANWTNCLKPWLIPDRWEELSTPPNDAYNDGVDYYQAPSSSGPGTGWSTAQIGETLMLKPGNPQQAINPSNFYIIEDANTYEQAITGCQIQKGIGDTVTTLPGNRVGPTNHGVDALTSNGPVVVPVAMFSPAEYAARERTTGTFPLTIVNMMGFKIEGRQGNHIYGTIVAGPGEFSSTHGTVGDTASMFKTIRLVQ